MNEIKSTTTDWAAARRAKLDQVAAAHAARVLPLAEQHEIPAESCALIILSLAASLIDEDDQLAAITRSVVATVEEHQRVAFERAAVVTDYPTAVPLADELAAEAARRKQADR